MKVAYNTTTGLVVQEFETAPQFEHVEVTPEIQAEIDSMIKPKLENGQIVEGASEVDIQQKVVDYRKMIYDDYERLYSSSLVRAVNKAGQGLSDTQLERLKTEYEQKKAVAESYLSTGNASNVTLFSTISFEVDADYAEPKLANEIAHLNTEYSAGIPTENVTRLQQYCYLIIAKYNLASSLWELLKALCATFRSKLITNLDNLEFSKIDERRAIIASITNNTTIPEIIALEAQFNAV